jgi:pimeloyl-ACP methyl ester carboxylesterase
VLADYLTRRGIAVLRFDDRGVGKSGGTLAGTTSLDYAADAQAAMAWLRARPEVKKNKVGLVGHSQGGTSAIEAAGQPLGPNMLVLLAAPGLPGNELIVQQVLAMARLQTADSVQLAYIERAQRQVVATVEQNPDNTQAHNKLLALLNQGGATDPAALARMEAQISQATSPSYRHLLADRPATTLPKVHCPVLALGGSKDAQVPAAPNLAAIKQGLQSSGNRDVTTQVLPGLNHLFQNAPTGSPSEYGIIEETFAPAALQLIGDWLLAHGR